MRSLNLLLNIKEKKIKTTIDENIKTFLLEFEKNITNLEFQFVNINGFINKWGKHFYDHFKIKLKELINSSDYKKYFSSAINFTTKFNKTKFLT